jgi:fructose-1,6-bisphosphatase/inositol monophosphatase family enzyme
MGIYKVEVVPLAYIVTVDARSEEEAIEKIEKQYREEGIPHEELGRMKIDTVGDWIEEVEHPTQLAK